MNRPLRLCGVGLLGLMALALPALAQDTVKKHALLVGVADYNAENIPPLKYTVNDIEKLSELLTREQGFATVTVLTNRRGEQDESLKPIAANIRKHLKGLLAKKGRNDLVWVAFAGHGMQVEVADPKNAGPNRTFPMLCPFDTDRTEAVDYATGRAETLINLNAEVFEPLGKCGAGTKIVLIDACRSDEKGRARNLATENAVVPSNVFGMFSCTNGERAWEHANLKHGVFFYHALEALRGQADNGKGQILWSRLTEYVTAKVPEYVEQHVRGGAKQRPHAYTSSTSNPVLLTVARADRPKIGEAERKYREGLDLLYGRGVPVNQARALQLLRGAAEGGDPRARAAVGFMVYFGQGTDSDPKKADALARESMAAVRKAAEDDRDAANWLGLLLQYGIGTKADPKEAFKWFQTSAEQGDPDAMDNLGNLYFYGQGVERDEKEAFRWYGKAADRNLPSGLLNLGNLYLVGRGTTKNEKEAFRLFKMAGDRGYAPGVRSVGKAYLLGWHVEKDPRMALEWLEKSVEWGDADGMLSLGHMYLIGEGVDQDREKGLRLINQAIDRHDRGAMAYLARALVTGRGGVEKDEEKARRLFDQAGAQGATAMHEMGSAFYRAKKFEDSFKWQLQSAKRGHVPAMVQVGTLYATAQGTDRDGKEAVAWLTKAWGRGNVESAFRLGQVHEIGLGVKKNTAEALKWYQKAADKGHKKAAERAEFLGRSA